MKCEWEHLGGTDYRCKQCGGRLEHRSHLPLEQIADKLPDCQVIAPIPTFSEIDHGPGTCLHRAIRRWIGAGPSATCSCRGRIARMNAWGPAGCRVHLEEIVDWLVEEADKRGWWRYSVALPGSRIFLRRMVVAAINKAESGLHYTST
ncbi:MAG: hypothetical protein GX616_00570 [Planctomycetes bacterium]|nr:hypothetical protein [Planctomycetota bacterium]